MKKLSFDIDCGEHTCASAPGKFCQYLQTQRFGTITSCRLFSEQSYKGINTPLEETDGWVQRHPLCLAAEKE